MCTRSKDFPLLEVRSSTTTRSVPLSIHQQMSEMLVEHLRSFDGVEAATADEIGVYRAEDPGRSQSGCAFLLSYRRYVLSLGIWLGDMRLFWR